MNPRYRRLLIPGLLVILIAVVLITSLVGQARGATVPTKAANGGYDVVSTMTDSRITESSGLVLSNSHPDLAYTINDSGNAPIVFAIRVSTGKVVGTTTVSGGPLIDTEAMSIDSDGTLWIADTGDNHSTRTDAALFALPEPGVGEHKVKARRYPVSYADGAQDVETLLINPRTGAKFLVSKGLVGGEVYPVPTSPKTDIPHVLTPLDVKVPLLVTDGAFTPDGRYAVLRTYIAIYVFDASNWRLVRTEPLPTQQQGETLAMEPSGDSILIGSEGVDSQLLRLGFSVESDVAVPTAPTMTHDPASSDRTAASDDGPTWAPWALGVAGVVVVAAGGLLIRHRR